MQKRFIFILALLLPLLSFAGEFVVGKDYELVSNQIEEKPSNNKVSVIEFFSYGCPWCYRIEPTIQNWIKQQNELIAFTRVPVVFNKEWIIYAKAYYTAKLLGLELKLHPLLFKTIQDKEKALNSTQAMTEFFTAQGVDPTTAKSAFENSTTIDLEINQGTARMSQYRITGVPAFVVANQYKTDLQRAQNEQRLIKILDYLVAKAGRKQG